jgi:hypothetical protein
MGEAKHFGRPSTYKPEYCKMLIEHMTQGLSFESFAGVVDSTKQTVYNWLELFPDFLDAKQQGAAKCLLTWEKIGNTGTLGKIKNFNAASYRFNMMNRFKWSEKNEVESNQSPVQITYTNNEDKSS